MNKEFQRYGLEKWRPVVGILQLMGAAGLLLGYFYVPVLSIIAAVGLSLLMMLGFTVRLKIKDNIVQSSPSFIYAVINAYIAIMLLQNMHIF